MQLMGTGQAGGGGARRTRLAIDRHVVMLDVRLQQPASPLY